MKNRIKIGNGWPYDVTKSDLEITHIRGSGAGGQHRNKTSSGVYMVHKPTGLNARATEHREQPLNLKAAFKKLAAQLIPLMKKTVQRERYASGDKRVRTYHGVDNRVVDEELGRVGTYGEILDGDGLSDIIEKRLRPRPHDGDL